MDRNTVGTVHRHVVSNVAMTLVDDVGDVAVGAEFRYTTRDPYAVQATFCRNGFGRVVWTFARELLAVGLARPAGIGDVQIEPDGSSVVLILSSPEGTAELVAQAADVRRFVSRTLSIVPLGAEPTYVDLDAELALFDGSISAGGDS